LNSCCLATYQSTRPADAQNTPCPQARASRSHPPRFTRRPPITDFAIRGSAAPVWNSAAAVGSSTVFLSRASRPWNAAAGAVRRTADSSIVRSAACILQVFPGAIEPGAPAVPHRLTDRRCVGRRCRDRSAGGHARPKRVTCKAASPHVTYTPLHPAGLACGWGASRGVCS
jgi:hypothetical protein